MLHADPPRRPLAGTRPRILRRLGSPPAVALACALALLAGRAAADPGYYVVSPYSQPGVSTIDLRYWTVKPRGGAEEVWPELGFFHGVNSRWTTGLFISWIGPSDLRSHVSTLNWQNNLMLTQGEWPVDIALHTQFIRDQTGHHEHAIEFGPLLQTDIGRTQLNLNLILDREFGARAARPTRLKYQWQLRHRLWPRWHVGAQGFGEVGPWDDFAPHARQSHRAGPAVFGTIRFGAGSEALRVQAAWLEGRTWTQRGHMFTLRAAYDF